MSHQHTTVSVQGSLALITTSLKNEKQNVLIQIAAGAVVLYLSPKQGEERIKTVYKKAGFVRKDNNNALSTAGLQRLKAAQKLVDIRKESILHIIESSATEQAAHERISAMIVKDFLPTPNFPLQVNNKFLPMLMLGLTAQQTKDLLLGTKAQAEAIEEDNSTDAVEGEGEESTVDGNPEITAPIVPATLEQELDACITRFYELTTKVKSGDIESLTKVECFVNTIVNATLLLHNVHQVKTPQGETVSFVNYNEGLCSKLLGTLKKAVINIKPKLNKKVRVNDIIPSHKLQELEAHFAA